MDMMKLGTLYYSLIELVECKRLDTRPTDETDQPLIELQ